MALQGNLFALVNNFKQSIYILSSSIHKRCLLFTPEHIHTLCSYLSFFLPEYISVLQSSSLPVPLLSPPPLYDSTYTNKFCTCRQFTNSGLIFFTPEEYLLQLSLIILDYLTAALMNSEEARVEEKHFLLLYHEAICPLPVTWLLQAEDPLFIINVCNVLYTGSSTVAFTHVLGSEHIKRGGFN